MCCSNGVERVKHLKKSRERKLWWGDWVEARDERAVLLWGRGRMFGGNGLTLNQ